MTSHSIDPSSASDRGDFHWNLEYQTPNYNTDTPAPWRVLVTFTENECFPEDAEAYSFLVCNKPGYFLQDYVLVVRHLFVEELDQEGLAEAAEEFAQYSEDERKTFVCEYILFGNTVKRYIGGRDSVMRTLESEADRVEALRELFALDVTEAGYRHILGRRSSLDK